MPLGSTLEVSRLGERAAGWRCQLPSTRHSLPASRPHRAADGGPSAAPGLSISVQSSSFRPSAATQRGAPSLRPSLCGRSTILRRLAGEVDNGRRLEAGRVADTDEIDVGESPETSYTSPGAGVPSRNPTQGAAGSREHVRRTRRDRDPTAPVGATEPTLKVNINVVSRRARSSTSTLPPSVDRSRSWRRTRNVWVVVRLSIGATTGRDDGANAERSD